MPALLPRSIRGPAAFLVALAAAVPSVVAAMEPSDVGSAVEKHALTDAGTLRANEVIGRDIVTAAGENLGVVDDLVISPDGRITHGIVGVGGLLGIGKTHVLIPVERLQLSNVAGESAIVMTPDELKAMPPFDIGVPESASLDSQRDLMGRTMADWEMRMKNYASGAKSAAKSATEGTADTVESAWTETKEAWAEVKAASAETWDKAKARFQSAMDRMEKTWNDKGEPDTKT